MLRKNGDSTWEQTYLIRAREGMTVLDALLEVQSEHDPTLAFHHACHWGMCGSCAMLVNGMPRLACRTKLDEVEEGPPLTALPARPRPPEPGEIYLSPLSNFPVVKDLVVVRRPFFELYRSEEPWFRATGEAPDTERPRPPEDAEETEKHAGCILCGTCHRVYSQGVSGHPFPGPAALAKLYRFAVCPREGRKAERLASAGWPEGRPACGFHGNCRRAFPEQASPDRATGEACDGIRRMK